MVVLLRLVLRYAYSLDCGGVSLESIALIGSHAEMTANESGSQARVG
jgi:hypothetical protein